MKQVYFFTGLNKYLIDLEIQKIIKEAKVDELSLVKYDCEETLIESVLQDCETLPFLSDQKVIIIQNPSFLTTEKNKLDHNVDLLSAYLMHPNPSTILVINALDAKIDKKRKLYKLILDTCEVKNFDQISETDAFHLIQTFMNKRHIELKDEVIYELISRTECDAFKIYGELEKISFYIEGVSSLTLSELKQLVAEPMENNIFNLTNSILENNPTKAMEIYQKLKQQNEEPIVFSAILGKNFHHIYVIKQYQKKGYNEYQLRSILKIHPFQLKKFFSVAEMSAEAAIIHTLNSLYRYDSEVKTGKIDKHLGFELLILNI